MNSGSPIKAILFDVGGPIFTEDPGYDLINTTTRQLISNEIGRQISDDEFEKAMYSAINSWAPSLIRSVIWQFLKPDAKLTDTLHRKVAQEFLAQESEPTLTEGIDQVIRTLARSFKLALAANQPRLVRKKLEQTGLMEFFVSTVVSGDLGLSKPDSRLFLAICERIGTEPENCIMIGDRLDNDIYPANILGMRTIWIKSGPHARQEPRIPEDVPDAVVEKMPDVIDIIERWKKDEGSD